jgi:hypothetical protein
MAQTRKKAGALIEYVSESTTACLVTMVQGNLLSLTVGHLLIASQTGVIAAAIASLTLFFSRVRSRWLIAAVLGVATAVVDFFVHEGQFGPIAMEAFVTGFAAAILSYGVGSVIHAMRSGNSDRNSTTQTVNDNEAG